MITVPEHDHRHSCSEGQPLPLRLPASSLLIVSFSSQLPLTPLSFLFSLSSSLILPRLMWDHLTIVITLTGHETTIIVVFLIVIFHYFAGSCDFPPLHSSETGPIHGHVGDGNFHSCLVFDMSDTGIKDRIKDSAEELGLYVISPSHVMS